MSLDKINALSSEDIFSKAAGLLEFGCDRTPVTEKWKKVNEEREFQPNPISAVAALNNADLNKSLLKLLKKEPDKIFTGLCAAAKAVCADAKIVCIPKDEETLAEEISKKAAEYGVEIETGIVNVRAVRGGAYHHFQTLIALAELLDGTYWKGTYVAVCRDGKIGEAEKISYGTKVSELIGNTDGIRAFSLGNKLYTADNLDMVIEEDMNIGNGVLTLYSDKCCMVHEACVITEAYRKASCGKCTFCREGLIQLSAMLKDATSGHGEKEYSSIIQEIAEAMSFSTQCTIGSMGAQFALESVKLFPDEYNDHLKKKKCKNNVCNAFSSIYIDPTVCVGCGDCMDECPKEAIEGKPGYIHMIDEYECLTEAMLPTPVAIVVGVIVGIALSAFNGFISNLFTIHPMIVSLATMTMYSGISYTVSGSRSYSHFPNDFMAIGQGKIGMITIPIILFVIVVVVFSFVLSKTCFGRFIYAVGGNPEAAHLAGINVKKVKLTVFCIAGVLFALADVVLISRGGSANSTMGPGTEFDGITACVLGGVSFIGGAGKIRGALVGCLIIGVLSNGMQLAGMGVYAQSIVKGAILIVSIAIDTFQQKAKATAKKAA